MTITSVIRIEGTSESCSALSAGPHCQNTNRMTLTQDSHTIWLDREGAALLADFLTKWATGAQGTGEDA